MIYAALAACWFFYFLIHSLLASTAAKSYVARKWPAFPSWYRLAYNLLALLLLLPVSALLWGNSWPMLWQWHGWAAAIAVMLKFLAIGGFWYSLRYYDMAEFLGLKKREGAGFVISPFHRFVRHPWYFFAMVIIWTSDINSGQFLSYSLISLYFLLGSRLEEKKLERDFGERYRRYAERVPGLFPLPWKFLSRDEAEQLANDQVFSDWKK